MIGTVVQKPQNSQLKAYKEVTIGKTVYRITSIYLGEIDLKETLENLTVRKVMEEITSSENAALMSN